MKRVVFCMILVGFSYASAEITNKKQEKKRVDFFKDVTSYDECKKACKKYVEHLDKNGLISVGDTVGEAYERAIDEHCYVYLHKKNCPKSHEYYKKCKKTCENKVEKLVNDGALSGDDLEDEYTICIDKECSTAYGKACCLENCAGEKKCSAKCTDKFEKK